MNAELLLRISSVIMLLHLAGHMFGHLTWKKSKDAVRQGIIDQMLRHKLPFMGKTRSLGEYYDGYGYAAALAMLLSATLLWILAGFMGINAEIVRMLLWPISVFLIVWGIDELIFFFPFAAMFSLLSGILSIIAIIL